MENRAHLGNIDAYMQEHNSKDFKANKFFEWAYKVSDDIEQQHEQLKTEGKLFPHSLTDGKYTWNDLQTFANEINPNPDSGVRYVAYICDSDFTNRDFRDKIYTDFVQYTRGVTIHVEDKKLIQILQISKLESVLCDIRLPFPCIELAFPKGIPLGYKDYEVGAITIVDYDVLRPSIVSPENFTEEDDPDETNFLYLNTHVSRIGSHGEPEQQIKWTYCKKLTIEQNIKRMKMKCQDDSEDNQCDKNCEDCAFVKEQNEKIDKAKEKARLKADNKNPPNINRLIKKLFDRFTGLLNKKKPQLNGKKEYRKKDAWEEKDEILLRHFVLSMALLLYCQAQQDTRALVPSLHKPPNSNLKGVMKKKDKRKTHHKIINLLPDMPKFSKTSHGNGTHNSPIPHWRGYVFRTLTHPKYKRNDDGSCKVIMVDPCIVGLKKNEKVHSNRKIKP